MLSCINTLTTPAIHKDNTERRLGHNPRHGNHRHVIEAMPREFFTEADLKYILPYTHGSSNVNPGSYIEVQNGKPSRYNISFLNIKSIDFRLMSSSTFLHFPFSIQSFLNAYCVYFRWSNTDYEL